MLALALLVTCIGQADARKISRVIIDPGHGGKDKGANRGTVYEKDLALKVAFLRGENAQGQRHASNHDTPQ